MSQLPISNVVQVSVSAAQTGIGAYNTSNLSIFTDEAPNLATFGSNGYAIYLSPTQVGVDFGSSSKTFAMANAVFSQQPNILAGGGSLVVILLQNTIQTLTFSGIAASGSFVLNSSNGATAAINWNDSTAQIQTKVQAVTGQSEWIVTGTIAGELLTIQTAGTYGPVTLFTISSDTLQTSGSSPVTVTPLVTQTGEHIGAAITRTSTLVQYFGLMVDEDIGVIGQTDLLAAAAIVQPLNKIAFWVSSNSADISLGGALDLLRSESFTQSRGLYYANTSITPDYVFCAAYAGRALSTNFSGSNTTQTMHLKTLIGVASDTTITQTLLNTAVAAGVDTYPNLQGIGVVFTSGLNSFFDQVYNLQWFVGAIQVAGFNFLATTSTKVPQTELGMDGLKSAYRQVCLQAVSNAYAAPGTWNSATMFGNGTDLITNIANFGYYIFSTPIAQQAQTDRAARKAPLVQLALKEAGSIQSSTVVIVVNP